MSTLVDREFIRFLPGLPKDFLKTLEIAAKNTSIRRIAIVGGVIRDQLIHIIHGSSLQNYKDLDFIVEGSASKIGKEIQNLLGKNKVIISQENKSLDTVQLKIEALYIDIASARIETYDWPGENPKVKNASIEEDLKRRDFTINAIALEILNNKFIDLFNGINDIQDKVLRFIHSSSVKDDPTRIIRGARYAARIGFNLEESSLEQIKATINSWPWNDEKFGVSNLGPPALTSRLRMELNILFSNELWHIAITKLQEWGALKLLDEDIQNDRGFHKRVRWGIRLGVQPLTALIARAKDPFLLASRLQLASRQQSLLKEAIELKKLMDSINSSKKYSSWRPSRWCKELETRRWDPQSVAIVICLGVPLWKPLMQWWGKWRLIRSDVTAKDLIKQGWEPGLQIGKELKRLRIIELDKLDQ